MLSVHIDKNPEIYAKLIGLVGHVNDKRIMVFCWHQLLMDCQAVVRSGSE